MENNVHKIIIEVKDATMQFKETTALDKVSLDIESNKVYGLIGRNGSGKTVLLKSICGLLKLTTGTIKVNGKIIGKDVETPKNVGAIIESPGFINNFSGYKNLLFLALINKKISKDDVKAAMRFVNLDPTSRKHVCKYSLGMRQRLGIVQAIMEKPDILILDEPTNGLDKRGVEDFRKYISELKNQGITIIIASHNTQDIESLCDEVIEMEEGKMIRKELMNSVVINVSFQQNSFQKAIQTIFFIYYFK